MNITHITNEAPACYGICCPKHGQCARYEAVETTSMDHTISTCEDAAGQRPLFIDVKQEPAP